MIDSEKKSSEINDRITLMVESETKIVGKLSEIHRGVNENFDKIFERVSSMEKINI